MVVFPIDYRRTNLLLIKYKGEAMLSRVRTIYTSVGVCAILSIFSLCPSYAVITTTSEKIEVPCNESPDTEDWVVYRGQENIQYSLETIGIKLMERPDLVIYWTDEIRELSGSTLPQVDAKCTSPAGHEYWVGMWGPGKIIRCERGYGLSIMFFTPNDQNPNKYRYAATLTITQYDDEQEEVVEEISTTVLPLVVPDLVSPSTEKPLENPSLVAIPSQAVPNLLQNLRAGLSFFCISSL